MTSDDAQDIAKHIRLTETATAHIVEQMQKRGRGLGVRVKIRKTGCSGLAYVVEFADEEETGDYVVPINDTSYRLYMQPKTYAYIKDSTLDYVERGLNKGFEFINPNEKARCGCGESFTV